MSLFRSFVVATITAIALSSPTVNGVPRDVPATHTLHERHAPHWQQHWTKRSRVPTDTVLPVRIGLTQPNRDAGHDLLLELSDPKSSKYGQHLTVQEVHDLFAPTQDSVDAVTEWLTLSGISSSRVSQSTNKQWIQFDAGTSELERLLYAEYYTWEDPHGSSDISCDSYYVPSDVRSHVDYVTPGIRMRSRVKREKPKMIPLPAEHAEVLTKRHTQARISGPGVVNSTNCDLYVTASCIRKQYGLPNGTKAAAGNELGIYENDDDHYSRADLDVYFSTLEPYIPNGTYPEERLVDGAVGAVEEDYSVGWGEESDLDFQAAWPLIWPQKTVLFQEDDQYYETHNQDMIDNSTYPGYWNTFYDAIDGSYCTYSAYNETGDCTTDDCRDPVYPDPNPGGYNGSKQCGVYKPTNVISMSYAFGENLLPASYLKRQCDEILKLALQGVTVLVSSGDGGVGGLENCPGEHHEIFHPLTPGSCPYALSVGSTEIDRAADGSLYEVPTTRFGSGGGFSNVFATPSYQKSQVETYFNTTTLNFTGYTQFVDGNNFSSVTNGGLYHIGGRGAPDVAAIGDRFVIYWNGTWNTVGGTSVSAPVWGAILTLVNEERLAKNQSTLGFVHPLLYAHPEVFNDITTGFNPGCNASYSNGFPAAKGWDPVSGLGTPIFPKLLDVLLKV